MKDRIYHLYIIAAKRHRPGSLSRVEFVKIGHSSNFESRFRAINYSTPMHLKLIALASDTSKQNILCLERSFHKKFPLEKFKGEWFHVYDSGFLAKYIDFLTSSHPGVQTWE